MKRKSVAVLRLQETWPDLRYIEDAKKNLEIRIEQCDIDRAKPRNPGRCAVRMNVNRTQECEDVIVGRSTAYLKFGDMAVRYIVPVKAQKELIAFDRGGKFLPGLYELKKPWAGNTLKAMRNQAPHPTKVKGAQGPQDPLNQWTRPKIQSQM